MSNPIPKIAAKMTLAYHGLLRAYACTRPQQTQGISIMDSWLLSVQQGAHDYSVQDRVQVYYMISISLWVYKRKRPRTFLVNAEL